MYLLNSYKVFAIFKFFKLKNFSKRAIILHLFTGKLSDVFNFMIFTTTYNFFVFRTMKTFLLLALLPTTIISVDATKRCWFCSIDSRVDSKSFGGLLWLYRVFILLRFNVLHAQMRPICQVKLRTPKKRFFPFVFAWQSGNFCVFRSKRCWELNWIKFFDCWRICYF